MRARSFLKSRLNVTNVIELIASVLVIVCVAWFMRDTIIFNTPHSEYQTLCKVTIVASSGIAFFAILLMKFTNLKLHWIYCIVGLLLGALTIFVIPPYMVPDGINHSYGAIEISNKIMHYGEPADPGAIYARVTEHDAPLFPHPSNGYYNAYLASLKEE